MEHRACWLLFLPQVAAVLSTPALASGYGLRESSAIAMGAAYAGASATGSDASFLSYNPASIGGVEQYDASVSVVGIFPSSSATFGTAITSAATPAGGLASPDNFIGDAAVPDVAARLRLSPNWLAGLSIHAPWGLATDYPDGWAGRYHALNTSLLTVNIQPVLAYQPNGSWTFAAGLQAQYAKGKLSTATDIGTLGAQFLIPGAIPGAQDGTAEFSADDWAFGFTLGVVTEMPGGGSVGLAYRSAVHHTLEGPLTFSLDTAGVGAVISGAAGLFADTTAQAGLDTPETASLGARVPLAQGWTGLVEFAWTNWSRFRELRIRAANPFQPDDVTIANWDDSWFVALGAEYQPNASWTWRAGAAFDQSPIPSATLNPRIPDADRTWVSAGFTYRATANIDVGVSVAHLFLPERTVNLTAAQPGNALRGNIAGRTKSSVNVIGLQLNYHLN